MRTGYLELETRLQAGSRRAYVGAASPSCDTVTTAYPVLSRNDIMEELSLVYVRAVAARAGFAVEEIRRDRDSVDLHIHARGPLAGGLLHSPSLAVQLKSTALDLPEGVAGFPYDLKVKNYNELVPLTATPRVLVVFLLPEAADRWLGWTDEALVLRRAAYWLSLYGRPATANAATVRIQMPRAQVFDGPGISGLLERISRQEAIGP